MRITSKLRRSDKQLKNLVAFNEVDDAGLVKVPGHTNFGGTIYIRRTNFVLEAEIPAELTIVVATPDEVS